MDKFMGSSSMRIYDPLRESISFYHRDILIREIPLMHLFESNGQNDGTRDLGLSGRRAYRKAFRTAKAHRKILSSGADGDS